MTPRALCFAVRSALSRRDTRALARAAREAGPQALAQAWPGLPALGRAAAFRALDAKDRARAFAALDQDGRWLAYLASTSEGAAPLLEGASAATQRLLRRPGARETAAMRRALSGRRA
ncbi:MAG: hypothetical protein HKL90_06025 [Elusimicrobia bacterium]|nr:hypothetical protein [Elusimicrobiota bacterium]